MKRSECLMTFSQALEQYLTARERLYNCAGWPKQVARLEARIKEAQEHMDALTDNETE